MLKQYDQYSEIRQEFGISQFSSELSPRPNKNEDSPTIQNSEIPKDLKSLTELVVQLRNDYSKLKSEFDTFKENQSLKNEKYDALFKTLNSAPQISRRKTSVTTQSTPSMAPSLTPFRFPESSLSEKSHSTEGLISAKVGGMTVDMNSNN